MQRRYLSLMIIAALIFSTACSLTSTLPSAALPTAAGQTIEPLFTATPGTVFIDARTQTAALVQPTAQQQAASVQSVSAQSVVQSGSVQSGGSSCYSNCNPTYYVPSYCTPRYDWGYSYVVQRGDTLSNIAQRANVSLQTLAQGNCIANPNLIYVGQTLRVPCPVSYNPPPYYPPHNPPPYYPPTQQPGGYWQSIGQVLPSPFVSNSGGQYELQGGSVVSLSWAINASGLTRVEFYFAPSGTGSTPVLIGTDTYFGDGVSMAWAVPPGLLGTLSANGYIGSGLVKQTASYTFVYAGASPTQPPPTPLPPVIVGSALSFSPYGEINNNTVMLPPDQLIQIVWNGSFPTATDRVEFRLVSPIDGSSQSLGGRFEPRRRRVDCVERRPRDAGDAERDRLLQQWLCAAVQRQLLRHRPRPVLRTAGG